MAASPCQEADRQQAADNKLSCCKLANILRLMLTNFRSDKV